MYKNVQIESSDVVMYNMHGHACMNSEERLEIRNIIVIQTKWQIEL